MAGILALVGIPVSISFPALPLQAVMVALLASVTAFALSMMRGAHLVVISTQADKREIQQRLLGSEGKLRKARAKVSELEARDNGKWSMGGVSVRGSSFVGNGTAIVTDGGIIDVQDAHFRDNGTAIERG